ncbi:hypothetical protein DFH09DRAFT_1170764 [Mycena vulgaris]|nr:hypothetical protein DFH09DRAFT_1170764 [Mycena vulgaris]
MPRGVFGIPRLQWARRDFQCLIIDEDGNRLKPHSTKIGPAGEMICAYDGGTKCTYQEGTLKSDTGMSCPAKLATAPGSESESASSIHSTTSSIPFPPTAPLSTHIPGSTIRFTSTATTDTSHHINATRTPSSSGKPSSSRTPSSSTAASTTKGAVPFSAPGPIGVVTRTSYPASSQTTISASPVQSTTMAGPTHPLSIGGAGKSAVSPGKIAGIAGTVMTLPVLLVMLIFYTRRRSARSRAVLKPAFHLELSAGYVTAAATEKDHEIATHMNTMRERSLASPISSQAAEIRQAYLRHRILAARRELEALNDGVSVVSFPNPGGRALGDDGEGALEQARQQIQTLQERIGMLDSQLQSQWALVLSDDPPPGYLE